MARIKMTSIPVESSWRMVEGGENDSFDTSIVQDPLDDDFLLSSQSQQTQPSQSSQGLGFGSQDSISDFVDKADDDHLILRSPFYPSLSSTRRVSVDKDRTPVPEFFMPSVDVSSQQSGAYRSPRAAHPSLQNEPQFVRRRGNRPEANTRPFNATQNSPHNQQPHATSLIDRFTTSVPEVLFNFAAWMFSTFTMAFRYAQWPLAIILALYLIIGACILAKDTLVSSISSPLAPLCRIPGVSLMGLPFCANARPEPPNGPSTSGSVEFDELMNVQANFEKVLEDSASGVSLPMEMKRSEASVRDLRTMVKYSDLPTRDEMVLEFDNYIDHVRTSANGLQMFNTHVGGAVDSVISINRWTSRYIDSIAAHREENNNALARITGWLFSPFQPSVFDERVLFNKYVEHTALVSEKIATLIVEAQAVLRQLQGAENSLQLINEHVVRDGNFVKEKQSQILWDIWTIVGGNRRQLHNLNAQLKLLFRVETQRNSAVQQLTALIHDLIDIETKLGDLRDRVAAPELVANQAIIPLSVHIETINAGVERLESARRRIRAEENERLQQVLARARENDRLIDG
ncbi:hypothetical protein GGS23DRAFT_562247 [Durotheca rogersii]|uniref:uncharacterized protein n=1 Tax=Durotheca rogersii TaxID=419775 RepID=UPI00222106C7|nr:uncharacterized protein GGS23DRAFT_562247 [Durotheca rogersii]KAI5864882.1 hypothetical protein GGS23DRAFT_562247 [Durotheca rogersii]